MQRVGIPMSNKTNWKVGQSLTGLAAKKGIEPDRILTEKTDPNPTVNAKHCIAHYPMEMFDEAVEHVTKMWEGSPDNTETQFQLFKD